MAGQDMSDRGERSEAESKEKPGVWDPMPELTMNSPYVHSESTPTHFPSGIQCQSRLYPPVKDFGFLASENDTECGWGGGGGGSYWLLVCTVHSAMFICGVVFMDDLISYINLR
jgi:hypothetical protein